MVTTHQLLTQIKDLLIKFGIGNLTKWQVTTILLGTYFLWPKLKPNMRLLLNRMYLQVLSARDMIVSKVATHLIGLTTTGLTLALASRNNADLLLRQLDAARAAMLPCASLWAAVCDPHGIPPSDGVWTRESRVEGRRRPKKAEVADVVAICVQTSL